MLELDNGDLIDPKAITAIRVLKAIKKGKSYVGSKRTKPRVVVNWEGGYASVCYFGTLYEAKDYQSDLAAELHEALE